MNSLLIDVLSPVIAFARTEDIPVYLVGGMVRDALRKVPAEKDFDVTVLGDAVSFARGFAGVHRAQLVTHDRFKTATVSKIEGVPDLVCIDFVSARSESYPKPGGLPVVEFGSFSDDISRRDFTINTLAISLDDELLVDLQSGREAYVVLSERVIDQVGGLADLSSATVRVLHERSFLDDPTRIFRAARYAVRIQGQLDSTSETLLSRAVASGALQTISQNRVLRELRLVLDEVASLEAAVLLESWGVFNELGLPPCVSFCRRLREERLSTAIDAVNHEVWEFTVMLETEERNRKELLGKFGYGKKWLRVFTAGLDSLERNALQEVPRALLYAMLLVDGSDSSRQAIRLYLEKDLRNEPG